MFKWDGEAMRPHLIEQAARQYTVGENYYLDAVDEAWDEKTESFRRAYFAMMREAFRNLPETVARFRDHRHLRKWALIKLGYANEQDLVCESVADALRFTAYLGRVQPESVVSCKANVIKIWTAQSQRRSAMRPDEFKDSANAVLDLLSDIIGVNVRDLRRNADKAA
jgi:hypothetical protein